MPQLDNFSRVSDGSLNGRLNACPFAVRQIQNLHDVKAALMKFGMNFMLSEMLFDMVGANKLMKHLCVMTLRRAQKKIDCLI